MLRQNFIIKLCKNFYNYLLSFFIHPNLRTSPFRIGKQTTFVCGRCGVPFQAKDWAGVSLEEKVPLNNQHLISDYFKILKHTKFHRGVVIRPQIQYFEAIRESSGELMTCSGCNTSHFQNILLMKILDINIAVVL